MHPELSVWVMGQHVTDTEVLAHDPLAHCQLCRATRYCRITVVLWNRADRYIFAMGFLQ